MHYIIDPQPRNYFNFHSVWLGISIYLYIVFIYICSVSILWIIFSMLSLLSMLSMLSTYIRQVKICKKDKINHALPCIGVWYGALDTLQVGWSSLEQPCHFGLVLAIKRVIFGPPPAIDRCTERPKKVPHHLSYVWGRFRTPKVPVLIVTVTAVLKRWWK